jgi:probable phosphoglycerate mutase
VTRLLLVRHGQSEWNAVGRWQGQADPPLSELGERQARQAAARLPAVDAVWSSDLARAAGTAALVAAEVGAPVVVDRRLRERHAGEWQGLTRVEIEQRWPGYLADGRRPQGWEPDEQVVERALAACHAIAAAHPGAQVLVVTHGGVVRALERHLDARDDDPPANLGGRWIESDGETVALGERVVLTAPDSVTRPSQE